MSNNSPDTGETSSHKRKSENIADWPRKNKIKRSEVRSKRGRSSSSESSEYSSYQEHSNKKFREKNWYERKDRSRRPRSRESSYEHKDGSRRSRSRQRSHEHKDGSRRSRSRQRSHEHKDGSRRSYSRQRSYEHKDGSRRSYSRQRSYEYKDRSRRSRSREKSHERKDRSRRLHAREKSHERKVRSRRSRSREQRHKRKDRSERSRSPRRTDNHNRRDTFSSETEHNSFSDTSRSHGTDREYESSDTEKNISSKSIDNMKDFMEGDVQLSEKTLQILGDNSKDSSTDHVKVHNVLLTKWTDILQNGLIKETLEEVLKKFPFPKEFEAIAAPLVDPEFKYSLGESGLKKDNFQIISQNKIGAAMYAIALSLTIIFNDGCKVDPRITQYLSDAGRILGDVHYNVSIMRRAFILPKVNQTVKEISDGLPISKFLFGEELVSRMKAAKAVEKSSKDLMRPSTSGVKFKRSNQGSQPKKTHTPTYKRTPTNWRGSNRGGYKSRSRGNLDGPKRMNRPYRRQY